MTEISKRTRRAARWIRVVKWTLAGLGLVVGLVAAYAFWPAGTPSLEALADAAEGYDVRILRDTWGVPHVFGHTDPDAAFGLAYAHAEDDFLTIQQSLVAARGRLAELYGPDAAPNDYMVGLLRIWDTIGARYEVDLSPEARAMCEAYADGLNYYAALHPDQVLLASVFPVSGRDVVAGSVHKSPLFFGLDKALGELFGPERASEVSGRSGEGAVLPPGWPEERGSNTFSVSPLRSANGGTYLAVNSHQPWEGAVTWYEAHLVSEVGPDGGPGLDVAGALFPGMPVIVHGHNRDLGWAFTVNKPDLTDIYVLVTDTGEGGTGDGGGDGLPQRYLFDGQWLDFEVREVPIRAKLAGRLTWTVRETALWSVYGPVVHSEHGTYAIRYANHDRAGIYEQLYRMNRARDLDEWLDAVDERGFPCFNIGYADKGGNIAYIHNGAIPERSEAYDWSLYLPGDTSETLWTSYIPFTSLPQVINPRSGFVQNCNSSPYQTTIGPDNPRPEDFSPTLGIQANMTNRAWRALELFGADRSISPEEFYVYKYDMAYSTRSVMAVRVSRIVAAAEAARGGDVPLDAEGLPLFDEAALAQVAAALADPDLAQAVDLLRAWDLRAEPDSRGAALAVLTVQPYGGGEDEVPVTDLYAGLAEAVAGLKHHFGRIDPEWGEVNRLRRGDIDLPLGGGPDCLRNIAGRLEDDGRLRGVQGDSFVMLVTWDPNGRVSSQSIHQYGSATLDSASPHYADQAPLFAGLEMKPVWLDQADIRANLEREYRPGE